MGVGGQRHALAALPGSHCTGGRVDWSGWVQKISPPLGFYPWTIKP
jgi:hypothetical protein